MSSIIEVGLIEPLSAIQPDRKKPEYPVQDCHLRVLALKELGMSVGRLTRAFNANLSSINRRINALEGICPEAITLLQNKQFTPDVTRIHRNMKAARPPGRCGGADDCRHHHRGACRGLAQDHAA